MDLREKLVKKKAIIYLGGGSSQKYIIKSLKKNGIKVILIDRNFNCESKSYADFFLNYDLRDHKKIALFEFFEGVDYSFSVDFNRLTKLFEPNESEIQSQSSFIKKYAPNFFNNKTSDEIDIIKNLLTGTKENEMGIIFKNFNSRNYD